LEVSAMNLLTSVKFTRVANSAAVGTTAINGTVLDMTGYDGVLFLAEAGTITDGGLVLKAQGGAASDGSDAADLLGTATTLGNANDNAVAALDVYRPLERYLRPVVVRGGSTGAVLDGIIAVQYAASHKPTVQDATVAASKLVISPAYGTP
jgi:hypothetical protein